jgi:hypothetical protein
MIFGDVTCSNGLPRMFTAGDYCNSRGNALCPHEICPRPRLNGAERLTSPTFPIEYWGEADHTSRAVATCSRNILSLTEKNLTWRIG